MTFNLFGWLEYSLNSTKHQDVLLTTGSYPLTKFPFYTLQKHLLFDRIVNQTPFSIFKGYNSDPIFRVVSYHVYAKYFVENSTRQGFSPQPDIYWYKFISHRRWALLVFPSQILYLDAAVARFKPRFEGREKEVITGRETSSMSQGECVERTKMRGSNARGKCAGTRQFTVSLMIFWRHARENL